MQQNINFPMEISVISFKLGNFDESIEILNEQQHFR